MTREWTSTYWGALLTRADTWTLTLEDDVLIITKGKRTLRAPLGAIRKMQITYGLIWSQIDVPLKGQPNERLRGIPNPAARDMEQSIQDALRARERKREREREIQRLLSEVEERIDPIRTWHQECEQAIIQHIREPRWISEETIQSLEARRPDGTHHHPALATFLDEPQIQERIATLPQQSRTAITRWKRGIRLRVERVNADFLTSELGRYRDFFASIENAPLTDEQARAVVCFDNRVQAIAAAGSGKTSTLIARVAYAVRRNLVRPERVLILAFNKAAAKELNVRLEAALQRANLPSEGVAVNTFHAFGLSVIGQATGRKPSLAKDLDQDNGIQRLATLTDELKDADHGFRTKWDLFRLVFARDLPPFGQEHADPEDWDRERRCAGFRTLNGEVVKSRGERLIADWLFYNGVSYVYEEPYQYDTADAEHRQYYPDFYYPDADLYHEHLALDADGIPPADFDAYLDAMEWKRRTHRHYGTNLLETTTAELRSGDAFSAIEHALNARGVDLNPNPDRPVAGRSPIEHKALVKLFRTFLTHTKGNRLSNRDLRERLRTEDKAAFRYRHSIFLDLFFAIRAAWDRSLAGEGAVDFDDMLNMAADHIEEEHWTSPYQLVLVDEFQDVSKARARLVRALVSGPRSYLFAVGDDWQSIYRFAGSDISVMTGFSEWFGPSQQCQLRTTFRCPQWLCDLSSAFICKNPAQIPKEVISARAERTPRVAIYQTANERQINTALDNYLSTLYDEIATETTRSSANKRETVYILGRYQDDRNLLPTGCERRFGARLAIQFSTVHSAKGLEADHIVIPRLKRGKFGFPSDIEDDPVLHLAMPPDNQVHNAEERRLFYVALTRARKSLALFTVRQQPSVFVVELANEHGVEVVDVGNQQATEFAACPRCGGGALVERNGSHGKFVGCSRFPACLYTASLGRKRRHH